MSMDKNEFKKRLEEVAEIEILKPKKDPNIRLDDSAEDVVRVGDEWVELTSKVNPTLGFKFIKLKDNNQACELGCGKIVANQLIERRLCFSPKKHWRTRCSNCSCFVSPDGQSLVDGAHEIQRAYNRHFNAEKAQKEKPMPNRIGDDGREYIEVVTNTSIIRKYK